MTCHDECHDGKYIKIKTLACFCTYDDTQDRTQALHRGDLARAFQSGHRGSTKVFVIRRFARWSYTFDGL